MQLNNPIFDILSDTIMTSLDITLLSAGYDCIEDTYPKPQPSRNLFPSIWKEDAIAGLCFCLWMLSLTIFFCIA